MIIGLLRGNKKVWKVGSHEVIQQKRTRKHHYGYNIHKKEYYYWCRNCHQSAKTRDKMKRLKCWEVVENK